MVKIKINDFGILSVRDLELGQGKEQYHNHGVYKLISPLYLKEL